MTVRFYFCGGCNQRHDRGMFAERLRRKYGDVSFVMPAYEGECDGVIVICGCNAACANHHGYEGRYGKLIVRGAQDFDAACAFVEQISQKANI